MVLTEAGKKFLSKYALERLNSSKVTPTHKTKNAVVAVRHPVTKKIKIVRFGAQVMGYNYSPEARKNFKARHPKNIKKGRFFAAYWVDKFLWADAKGSKKNPLKSQKIKFGKVTK